VLGPLQTSIVAVGVGVGVGFGGGFGTEEKFGLSEAGDVDVRKDNVFFVVIAIVPDFV